MLKQEISYKDFDDNDQHEVLYFNITKTELTDHLYLRDRFEDLQKAFEGPQRQLTTDEVRQLLDLVKTFVKLSYGQRSSDGKHFRKSEQIWEDFVSSAVYDEFLFSLFRNPENAIAFLLGVVPADLRAEAEEVARKSQPELFAGDSNQSDQSDKVDDQPAWLRENREPTNEELLTMSNDEMAQAMRWKMNR